MNLYFILKTISNWIKNNKLPKSEKKRNFTPILKKIFLILFLFQNCSSSEKKDPIIIDTKPNPKFTAELKTSPEIISKVKEREKEFEWKKVPDLNTYKRIVSLKNSEVTKKNIEYLLKNKKISWQERYAYLQKLISFEIIQSNYPQAVTYLQKYKNDFPDLLKNINEIISILKENEGKVTLVLPEGEINEYESFGPVPELSGNKLYFTSSNTPGGKSGEEILEVTRKGNEWKEKKFLKELNTESHDSAVSVSPDGTELLVFGNYPGTLGNGDLFISMLSKNGWGKPVSLGSPINSPFFDSDGFFTPDGKAIIFVSDRPGGYFPYQKKNTFYGGDYWGNTDIYISFKNSDGSYGIPINLGPTINTPGAERTPFLHPDGKTLYFSSNGFNTGFGSLDLYKSIRLDETWTKWSEPVHLGKTLNTPGADWGFKMTASSDKGFISGLSKKNDNNNIYMVVPLPPRAKPENLVIAISGKITDGEEEPLEADIEWQDLDTGKSLGKLKSKLDGEFFITLPIGKNYGYYASKPGYFSMSQNINLSKERIYREIEIGIKLISIKNAAKSGREISLNNILFKSDSDELDERSHLELDRLYEILKINSSLRIEIQGHTSQAIGRPEVFNEELSLKRAKSVAKYVLSKGISENRIQVKGFGSTKPIVPNTTEENRIKNRRVTFMVIE